LRLRGGMAAFSSRRAALRLGITASYPSTLAALPEVRRRLADEPGSYPGADSLVRELVTVPTHSRVSTAERRETLRLPRAIGSDESAAA
ncbi:MAG: hypothetical protein M3409_11010, partial [Gemmatimonadota bacterium]|nr:hypothetical protein [Gemmatimonadota bacterium]